MNDKIAFLLNQQINKEFYSAYSQNFRKDGSCTTAAVSTKAARKPISFAKANISLSCITHTLFLCRISHPGGY